MSDKKIPIAVVISAVDNVTYKAIAIRDKLNRITAPIGKVKTALSNFGDESGFSKLMKGFGEIGSTGKELFDSISGAVTKLAGTAIAAGGAIYGVVHSFADAGDNVNTLSKRLGLTTDAYQELSYAALKAQVPQDEFDSAITKFTKSIGESAAGTGEALVAFNALGISIRDARTGAIKPMEQLLPQVADGLGSIHNQSLRNTIAMKLFGKQGAKLNEIFNEGSKGLAKLRQEARDVGAVMTPEQIKNAVEFDDGLKSVIATLLMVRNIVGSALAPVLLRLGETLQKYILSHKEEIKEWADQFAKNLPGYLQTLAELFKNLAAVIMPLVAIFNMLASAFGGFNVFLAGFFAYIGAGPIAALMKFVSAIGKALPAALEVAGIALTVLWDIMVGLFTFIAGIVGWPITIAIAVIGAFTLMYKKIQPFADFIDGLVGKVKGLFSGGADINSNVNMVPGPAMDFSKPVDAAARNSSSKNENHVTVDFNNLPQGSRVETKKADSLLDLNMGYGMQ